MAFLYAEARFGPELDPLQAQVPVRSSSVGLVALRLD